MRRKEGKACMRRFPISGHWAPWPGKMKVNPPVEVVGSMVVPRRVSGESQEWVGSLERIEAGGEIAKARRGKRVRPVVRVWAMSDMEYDERIDGRAFRRLVTLPWRDASSWAENGRRYCVCLLGSILESILESILDLPFASFFVDAGGWYASRMTCAFAPP